MNEPRRISSILVCGSGLVGLSAAVAFARALPHAKIRVLSLEQDRSTLSDRMPGTLPAVRFFHKLIGMDEMRVFRRARATHRLGTKFENWRADGETWFHAFGRFGAAIHASPFQHQWVRMQKNGRALPFDRYAPATALARSAKFVQPLKDPDSLLSSFDYALRLDPDAYRHLLADEAVRLRVTFLSGAIAEVQHDEHRVNGVVLTDGTYLKADFFIDCAGEAAPILSSVDGRFEEWGDCLPCDRLLMASAAPAAPTPVDAAVATDFGWRFSIPLLSRTLSGAVYSSAITGDDAVERAVERNIGLQPTEVIRFRPGRRPSTWVRNVVAFGDSAMVVDPLQATNLTIAQSSIRRAISLLPNCDFQPLLIQEFNRRTRLETERIRDFVSLHYLATTRTAGEFWRSMRSRPEPESLHHTLEQFQNRGRLPKYEEETFDDDSWLAAMFGLGVLPRRIDPTVYRVPEAQVESAMARIARISAELPSKLPPYPEYLAGMTAAA